MQLCKQGWSVSRPATRTMRTHCHKRRMPRNRRHVDVGSGDAGRTQTASASLRRSRPYASDDFEDEGTRGHLGGVPE
jgi:hypothetical protein